MEYKRTRTGPNVYRIVEQQDRHVLLECVWFSEKENLGDQIFCTQENQRIWVARYFFDHFYRIPS